MGHTTETEAIVQGIYSGHHGRFAVATAQAMAGSITFSLESPVWKESDEPEIGTCVVLNDIRKKRAGWRAMQACYQRPHHQAPVQY